jgi:flagellar motor component MotA
VDFRQLLGGLTLTGILCLAVLMGSSFSVFLDLPSFLVTIVGGAAAWLAMSGRGVSEAISTLRAPHPSGSELAAGLHTVRTGRRAFWLVGVLGTLIGWVQMLQALDDPAALGPALAVSLLTVVYAFVANIFIIGPMEQRIIAKRAVQTTSEASPQLDQDLAASRDALEALRQRAREKATHAP